MSGESAIDVAALLKNYTKERQMHNQIQTSHTIESSPVATKSFSRLYLFQYVCWQLS